MIIYTGQQIFFEISIAQDCFTHSDPLWPAKFKSGNDSALHALVLMQL